MCVFSPVALSVPKEGSFRCHILTTAVRRDKLGGCYGAVVLCYSIFYTPLENISLAPVLWTLDPHYFSCVTLEISLLSTMVCLLHVLFFVLGICLTAMEGCECAL